MEELKLNVFDQFDKKWALLTAGTPDSFNTMTISWGGFGTLWSKPVTTVYVKPVRYTYEFMEKNEFFTVSFFPEQYRKDLALLGSKSGRDGDKLALTSLTPVELEQGTGFREAELTVICRNADRGRFCVLRLKMRELLKIKSAGRRTQNRPKPLKK